MVIPKGRNKGYSWFRDVTQPPQGDGSDERWDSNLNSSLFFFIN